MGKKQRSGVEVWGGGGNNVLIDNFSAELPISPLGININAQRGREDEKIFFLHILPHVSRTQNKNEKNLKRQIDGGDIPRFISCRKW